MGRCKECNSLNVNLNDSETYVCMDCGYIGKVKEWIKKLFA